MLLKSRTIHDSISNVTYMSVLVWDLMDSVRYVLCYPGSHSNLCIQCILLVLGLLDCSWPTQQRQGRKAKRVKVTTQIIMTFMMVALMTDVSNHESKL